MIQAANWRGKVVPTFIVLFFFSFCSSTNDLGRVVGLFNDEVIARDKRVVEDLGDIHDARVT
jgi:hypothetical protein